MGPGNRFRLGDRGAMYEAGGTITVGPEKRVAVVVTVEDTDDTYPSVAAGDRTEKDLVHCAGGRMCRRGVRGGVRRVG